MNIGIWARLLLLGAPILSGCAGFWQKPETGNGTGSCTVNCSTATSGDFYILNSLNSGASGQIAGYSIVSGTLTAISGSPWTLTGAPYAMAMGSSSDYMYVSTNAGVYLYPLSSGVLGTGTPIDTNDQPSSLQVDVTGTWLIEAIQLSGGVQVNAVPITSTGALSGAQVYSPTYSSTSAALRPGQIAISGDNKYILLAAGPAGVMVIPFNASASGTSPLGSASLITPVNTGGSALSVAVDPSTTPRVLYIGETLANSSANSGALRVLSYSAIESGTVTNITNSPIATGTLAPTSILPTSGGDYIYVANASTTSAAGNIGSFALTNTGTSASPVYSIGAVSTATAGLYPIGLAVDSTNTFLLEVNQYGTPYFDSFTFDSNTPGQMDIQIASDTGASPVAVVAAP